MTNYLMVSKCVKPFGFELDFFFFVTIRFKWFRGSVRFGSSFKNCKWFGLDPLEPNRCRLLMASEIEYVLRGILMYEYNIHSVRGGHLCHTHA